MFPHACGAELDEAVRNGAAPKAVVPDSFQVVRGGTKPIPAAGTPFSATVGPTLDAAAAAVPHGQVRVTTAGSIRRLGGMIEWVPEESPHGTLNQQHVNVTEAGPSAFSELQPNPIPRKLRIDEGK